MNIKLTEAETVELLERAVAEKGEDYVYDRLTPGADPASICSYFDEDTGAQAALLGTCLLTRA